MANVWSLLRGTAVAQLIGIACLPMLSRLYAPESFGILQTMQSVLTVMLVGSALRLEVAVLSIERELLPHLLAVCGWACTALATATLIGVAVLSGTTHWLDRLGAAAYALPFALLFAGWSQVLSYLLLRHKQFHALARSKMSQAVGYAGTALGLASAWASAAGLAAADVAGRAAMTAASLPADVRKDLSTVLPTREAIAAIWLRCRELVVISLPGSLVNALGAAYAPVLVFVLFDANHAGQYALVERLLGAPIAMLCGAASQVFMATFHDAGESPVGRRHRFRRLVRAQLLLGALPAAALLASAPWLFPWILGTGWRTAGLFAQALTPLMLASFVTMPVNMALVLNGNQAMQFRWDAGRLALLGCTWYAVYALKLAPLHAVWLHSAVMSATYVVFLLMADAALGRDARPGASA